jgi:hypothetical protein
MKMGQGPLRISSLNHPLGGSPFCCRISMPAGPSPDLTRSLANSEAPPLHDLTPSILVVFAGHKACSLREIG